MLYITSTCWISLLLTLDLCLISCNTNDVLLVLVRKLSDIRWKTNYVSIKQTYSIFRQASSFAWNLLERKKVAKRNVVMGDLINIKTFIKETGFKFSYFVGLVLPTWKKLTNREKLQRWVDLLSNIKMHYKRNQLESLLFCWFLSPSSECHESAYTYVSVSFVWKWKKCVCEQSLYIEKI